MSKFNIPDGYEVVKSTPGDYRMEPDTDEKLLNIDTYKFSPPAGAYYKDDNVGKVKGHPTKNRNKIYNNLTANQFQEYLSDIYTQRIYTDDEGMKYQLLGSDGSRSYLQDQNEETSFLYGGVSKTNSNVLKFGVGKHGVEARYAPHSERKVYDKNGKAFGDDAGKQGRAVNKGKSKGYPEGRDGIDAKSAFMDWELPIDIAETAEKTIHGNYDNIDSRVMFDDNTLRGTNYRKRLGSGASEYYDGIELPMFNAETPEESFSSYIDRPESSIPETKPIETYKILGLNDDGIPDGYEAAKEDKGIYDTINDGLNSALDSVPHISPASTLESIISAIGSGKKIYDQADKHGIAPTLRDAGRGLTAGLYDSADVITSVGGLLPNDFSRGADTIANKIRADREIPGSEIERIAEHISEGAVGGVIGGKIGDKVFDSLGLNLSPKAQALRGKELEKSATVTAAGAEKTAKSMGATDLEAAIVKQNAYENMTKVSERKSVAKEFFGQDQDTLWIRNIDQPYTNELTAIEKLKKAYRDVTYAQPRKRADIPFRENHPDPGIDALMKDETERAFDPFYGLGDQFKREMKTNKQLADEFIERENNPFYGMGGTIEDMGRKTTKPVSAFNKPIYDGQVVSPGNSTAGDIFLPEQELANPYPVRMASAFKDNLDAKYGSRANLKNNDDAIIEIMSRNPDLSIDGATKAYMDSLSDKAPATGRDYGAVIGALIGGTGNETSADNPIYNWDGIK